MLFIFATGLFAGFVLGWSVRDYTDLPWNF